MVVALLWPVVYAGTEDSSESVVFSVSEYLPLLRAILQIGERPELMHMGDDGTQTIVVRGNSVNDWEEILRVKRLDDGISDVLTGSDCYQYFRNSTMKKCENWTVLAKDENSVTVQIDRSLCLPDESNDSLVRVLRGIAEVFVVRACVKGEMDEATRSGWLRLLESVQIEAYDKPGDGISQKPEDTVST